MDGMFNELFRPVLHREHKCNLDEDRVTQQKELRIIEALEPVLNQHRLIIDKAIIVADQKQEVQRQVFYQLTRVTKERNSLSHDDELDALSGAVRFFKDRLSIDTETTEESHNEEAIEREMREWMEGVTGISRKASNFLDRI
jgi:hypothetical protein